MKKYKVRLGFVALLVANLSVSAQIADDFSLLDEDALLFQDIPSVYSASKHEQKVTEAPSWVSIVTAQEIQLYGYRTLADILGSLPGFYVNYDRNYGFLGVRGFGLPGDYNSRIQLLINGHKMNDNIYSMAYIDRSLPLNVDLIERIEVVRGPSSSLYGSNAFFGVINIITRTGRDLEATEISASLGSQGTWETRVSYGERFSNGSEVLVSGSYYTSDGDTSLYYPEFDNPADNNGIAENVDGEERSEVFLQYTYLDFSLNFATGSREKIVPTASYEVVFNDPRNKTIEELGYLDLKYQTLLDNRSELLARFFYDKYAYFGDYLFDDGPPLGLVVYKDETYGDSWGIELQYSTSVVDRHHLITGIDFKQNLRQDQAYFDVDEVFLDDQRETSQWGLYLQDEYQLSDKWIINLGLRHDRFDNTDNSTNPRLGVIYQLDKGSSIKLLYGTAFRAPNAYELYYDDSSSSSPSQKSPDSLLPEDIKSLEIVYEKTASAGLHWVASVYHNQIDNLITLQTDPVDTLLVFENIGEAETTGADFEISKKFENKIELTGSISSQKTEDTSTGEELVNSPGNMAKLQLKMPLLNENTQLAVQLDYFDERKTVAGNNTDAFFVANINILAKEITKGLSLSASIYNLLDEEFYYPASGEHTQDQIMQDGRLFRVKVNYLF